MKKRTRRDRIVALLLVCIMCCSAVLLNGCGKKEMNSKGSDTNKEESNEPKLTESGYMLVEGGETLYTIVVPDEADKYTAWASEELQTFLAEATGVTLDIVPESQNTSKEYVISLGHTSVASELAKDATIVEDLGVSGYIMKTVGNSLVILPDSKTVDCEGVMYGVYDLLEDLIGFEVYAVDEIVYDKKDSVPLYVYDEKVTPDFDVRQYVSKYTELNKAHARRLRMTAADGGNAWYQAKALVGHSQVLKVLKYSKYGKEHPEWYSQGGMQLCWSAGAEMEKAFANELIQIIEATPDESIFHLFQEDQLGFCTCEKCMENLEKYGNYAGIQLVWGNHISDLVEEWRVKNAPEREIKLVLCTYMSTFEAPVKQNSDGKYEAIHEDCVPRKNLYFNYSPIEVDFSQEFTSPRNKAAYEELVKWTDLAPGQIFAYLYGTNYRWGMFPINNFNTMQSFYEELYKHGVTVMFTEGSHINQPGFTEMRLFVEMKLHWDVDCATYEELVDEFMDAYYQEAAPAMKKYYEYIIETYAGCTTVETGAIYANLSSPEVFTKENIDQMIVYMNEALKAIEPMRNTENEHFAKLYMRVKKDFLTVIYCQLQNYNLYYTEQELNDLAIEFNYICDYFNITSMGESGGAVFGAFDAYILEE